MHNTADAPVLRRSSWSIFVALFVVFWVAQPFDTSYSLKYVNREEQLENLDTQTVQLQTANVARRLAIGSLGLLSIIAIRRRANLAPRRRTALGGTIVVFLAWTSCSVLWADRLTLTLTRLAVLGALCLGVLAASRCWSLVDIMRFGAFSGAATLLVGVACEVLLGTLRPFADGYRFGGELNPIYQAYSCGMLILCAIALSRRSTARWLHYSSALIGFGCMLLTRSRGPVVALVIAVSIYWLLTSSRTRHIAVAAVIIAVPLVASIWLHPKGPAAFEQVLLLGRDDSSVDDLSGRVGVWKQCSEYLMQRPFLGYGYGGFWSVERFEAIARATGFLVPDAHNGYLSVALGTGLPGLLLALAVLVGSVCTSLHVAVRNADGAFACAAIVFFAVNQMLIAVQLEPYIPTFVVLAVIAKLAMSTPDVTWDSARNALRSLGDRSGADVLASHD